jgi:LacI family transcriptional regulator
MRSPRPDQPADDRSPKSTLGHVAKRAGVSPSTVSRILNGTAKVSAAKQAAVEEAIAALNFRPNPAARSLAGGKTMSVGVLTQFIDSPFYGEALRGIEDVLRDNHYVPLFVSGHWKVNEEEERLTLLQERKVDGIIVLTGKLSDEVLANMARQLPVVVTGRHLHSPTTHGIVFDDFRGAKLAVRHLIGLGHQRIAFISGPLDHFDAVQRLEGYKDELHSQGLAFDPELVIESDFQESGGYQAMNTLLASRTSFSGVFAANDQMAYGARLALSRAGFRVPEDISLVGFDDLPHSAFTLPPLTSVRQQVYEIGAMAANAMMALIRGEPISPSLVEAELVVRESTRRALR